MAADLPIIYCSGDDNRLHRKHRGGTFFFFFCYLHRKISWETLQSLTRMPLNRVHISTKAPKSPSIQSSLILIQTPWYWCFSSRSMHYSQTCLQMLKNALTILILQCYTMTKVIIQKVCQRHSQRHREILVHS